MDCIFCKIIAGEIPSFKVFEDERTLAFMDINPLSEGHLLVLPKAHFGTLFDGSEEQLASVMVTAKRVAVAMREVLGLDSMNLLQANGPWALQSVPHFHLHLIPRRKDDGVPLDPPLMAGDMEAIRQCGESIAQAITT